MNAPLVTCVIPCYNRSDFLREAIDSALNQSYPALEVIVVDDGSTDDTPEMLREYGQKITIVSQTNAGLPAARNNGVKAGSGEYVAWLDSDDAWHPRKIEAQVEWMAKHPEVSVVYTGCSFMDDKGHPEQPRLPEVMPEAEVVADFLRQCIVETKVIPSSCLLRRTDFELDGSYDTTFRYSEDWELNFRMARRGRKFAYLDAPLTRYRVHGNNLTNNKRPHAHYRLLLRHLIDAAQPELEQLDPSAEMKAAFRNHRKKYADAYHRMGKITLEDGNANEALEHLKKALDLDPTVFKFHTRYWNARVRSIFSRGDRDTVSSDQASPD